MAPACVRPIDPMARKFRTSSLQVTGTRRVMEALYGLHDLIQIDAAQDGNRKAKSQP